MLTVFSWKRLDKKRCSSLTSVSPQNSRQYLQLSRSTVRSLSVPQFYLFLLFPGQKAFISVSHPKQALPSVVLRQGFISIDLSNTFIRKALFPSYGKTRWKPGGLSGKAFYVTDVSMKVTRRLDGVDNCVVVNEDFEALLAANKEFEKWSDIQELRSPCL